MKKNISFVLSLVVVSSCWWSMPPKEKLYFKKIEGNGFVVSWFYYSLITSNTYDYVIVEKENVVDTICFSPNVKDVFVSGDTIFIDFFASNPPSHSEFGLKIPDNGLLYKIDSSYVEVITERYKYRRQLRDFNDSITGKYR